MTSKQENWFDRLILFIASGFGLSFLACYLSSILRNLKAVSIPEKWTGSGFFGTCLGFVFIVLGFPTQGLSGLIALIVATFLAIYIAGRAEKQLEVRDDQRIIIDEVIGYFWACAFLPLDAFDKNHKVLIFLCAFILFRIFDVLKLPFRKAQDLQGGTGVVADDFFAGLFANLFLQIAVRWFV